MCESPPPASRCYGVVRHVNTPRRARKRLLQAINKLTAVVKEIKESVPMALCFLGKSINHEGESFYFRGN